MKLKEFLKLFEKKNIEQIIKKINEYYNSGVDLIKLTNELVEFQRNKIINERKYDSYERSIIKQLDELTDTMKKSENPKIIFEITILNMLNDPKNTDKEPIKEEVETKVLTEEPKNSTKNDNEELKKIRVGNTLSDPQKNIISYIRNNWNELKNLAFDSNYGNLARLLSSDILPVAASQTNIILISKLNDIAEQINDDLYKVEKIFEIVFKKQYKVICISEKEWNEYIEIYKRNKNTFKYVEEKEVYKKQELTLKDKVKELFEIL